MIKFSELHIGNTIKTIGGFSFKALSKQSEPEIKPTAELIYSLSSDGSYYSVNGVDDSWAGGELIIPATYNGLPINSIKSYSFDANYKITSVTILEGQITEIGSYAFYDCSLINVILSKNIKYIRNRAFMYCGGLKNVIFPETLQLIESAAFASNGSSIYDFRKTEQVPTLANKNAISYAGSKIVVPDSLYDSWIIATNWSNYSRIIVKASEYVEA